MENVILYVLKINIIAAICILAVFILSYFVKARYSSQWKYAMWFSIAVFLLIPMNLFAETAVIELELPHHGNMAAVNAGLGDMLDFSNSGAKQQNSIPDKKEVVSPAKDSAQGGLPSVNVAGILKILCSIWVVGIFFLLICRIILYRVSLAGIRRWSMVAKDEMACRVYEETARELKIRKLPKLMVNGNLKSPLLAGLIDTRLYLPNISYTEREMKLIFTHELSHYRSRDLWYKMILLVVNTMYWFNPFLYLMVREAEKDIEYICDSRVVARCSRADCMLYNRLLLETAAQSGAVHYLSASLNDSTTAFKERILYMMKAKRLKKGIMPVIVLTVTLLVSNAAIGCTMKVYATVEKAAAPKAKTTVEDRTPLKTKNKAPEITPAAVQETKKAEPVPVKKETPAQAAAVPTATPEITPEVTAEPEPTAAPDAVSQPTDVVVQEVTPETSGEPSEGEKPAEDTPPAENPNVSGQVSANIQLFEGGYIDNGAKEDISGKYYGVGISDITDTSFGFTIYQVDTLAGTTEVVFLTNTAQFTGDGMTAECVGEDYALSFSFPDNQLTHPAATDMVISGFEPLEGKTFVFDIS